MLFNRFVISDDKFLQPTYRISPFKTMYISKYSKVIVSEKVDSYLNNKFKGDNYIYTKSGRDAIDKALCMLNLSSDDIVTIFTTSNNMYISGCVTKEIEKHCQWSREIKENTKVIFVNHEFGFPYEDLIDLKKYNLPIIEDCAHSFLSQNMNKNIGLVGDYVIYSLPKIFPIQFGGLLLTNTNKSLSQDISKEEEIYLKSVLSSNIDNIDYIKTKRILNYKYLEKKLLKLGFTSRFKIESYHCPGVYIFKTEEVDLNGLKVFLQAHGVECSIFYGEESFFIPVNQNLNYVDLDYFYTLIYYYTLVKEES